MDNLLESNERTLIIFDSVCSGLAECLALVHADIKQLTEHRTQLALVEQERLQSKLADPILEQSSGDLCEKQDMVQTDLDSSYTQEAAIKADEDDPHHLARLKLLDKRLADSFSQALSMCDQQKSSLVTKRQHYESAENCGHHRPSIFQVLLGKGFNSKTQQNSAHSNAAKDGKRRDLKSGKSGPEARDAKLDNRTVIDDINRQIRLAMQYSKQLEAHLFRVEDLRAKYEMHLKMGLVVKSVSRAYSSSTSTSSSSHYHSPGSLGRRPNRCVSSVAVNDTSSLGTNHSSLSSLNLSSWSFSRRNKSSSDRSSRKNSLASANCCTHQQAVLEENIASRYRHPENGYQQSQDYVSTISLDSMSRRAKRASATEMISPVTSPVDNQLQVQPGLRNHLVLHYDDQLPSETSSPAACRCQQQFPYPEQRASVIYGGRCQATPSPRPMSQYGDFIAPTSIGVTARGTPVDMIYMNQRSPSCVGNGSLGHSSLHKSASQSSLKNSKSKTKQLPIGAGKTTIKEFIENIERIESELESYMGSFLLNIEDVQGFARVCQGDVFEISIKYGQAQKFKTKISVLKDNRQKCDNRQTVFKSRIADVIAIKAYECKGLGKRVLLGRKLCETRELFTARSQLMTVSLNHTGSIKLNLIITWNPLHMTPNSSLALPPGLDIAHISLPQTRIPNSQTYK